jgi:hypothetical protein
LAPQRQELQVKKDRGDLLRWIWYGSRDVAKSARGLVGARKRAERLGGAEWMLVLVFPLHQRDWLRHAFSWNITWADCYKRQMTLNTSFEYILYLDYLTLQKKSKL